MANLAILLGNLGEAPELKQTESGKTFAIFDMATTETWVVDGEKRELTEWHRVEVWSKGRAEACANNLTKGSTVHVFGQIHTNRWDGPEGEKKSAKVIRATSVDFVRIKK